MRKLTTAKLRELFNEHFSTNHICIDLMDIIESKNEQALREYILKCFNKEFTQKEIADILEGIGL